MLEWRARYRLTAGVARVKLININDLTDCVLVVRCYSNIKLLLTSSICSWENKSPGENVSLNLSVKSPRKQMVSLGEARREEMKLQLTLLAKLAKLMA